MKKENLLNPSPLRYPVRTFDWDRGEVLSLARGNCPFCFGLGFNRGYKIWHTTGAPCICVLRRIFKQCYQKYRELRNTSLTNSHLSLEYLTNAARFNPFKDRDFVVDFETLGGKGLCLEEREIFILHYIRGYPYYTICAKKGYSKYRYFQYIIRIEAILAQVFRSIRPYPLFPIDEYFSGRLIHPIDRRKSVLTENT